MSPLDDRLTRELERVASPAAPAGVFERVDRRRGRRHVLRRVQAAALVVVVLAGTAGGFVYLSDAFRDQTMNVGDVSTPLPLPPKANGVIAAAQRSQGWLRLVSVNPDGSGREVIPTNVDAMGEPWLAAWSPDGARLAVAAAPAGLGPDAVWMMNADGSNPIKIAEATNVYQPSWSPDGTRVVYAADSSTESAIHVVGADGTRDHVIGEPLPPGRYSHYYSASFSPDGTRILYDAGTSSEYDIFVMSADGTTTTQLTSTGTDFDPSWSPDGSQIAFSRRGNGAGSDIYVMDADGSNVRRLTDRGDGVTNRYPTWSPDGTRIAYHVGSSGVIDGPGSLVIMDSDGNHPVTILDTGVMGFAWQPLPATATPAPAVADLGLGFPVCDVRSISADFDGDGTSDTASVVTKMSDVGGCPAPGTSTEVLVVDLNGDVKADAIGGPLACPTGCAPFAAPDVDGDGLPEVAIVVDRSTDGTKRIQVWDVTTPLGGTLAVIPFVDARGDPATFTWGSDGTNIYGVSCTSRTSPPLVTEWQAVPTGRPGSYHVSEHAYHVVGTELTAAFENSYDVPGDGTAIPEGGGETMCGAPVHGTG